MKKNPAILFLCLLAASSCRQGALHIDEDRCAHLTFKIAGLLPKSTPDEGTALENGICEMALFIFDSDDKLYLREDFSYPGTLHTTLPPGAYRFRVCTGDIPRNVSSLNEYSSYGQSFTCNGYSGGFCMGAEGEFSLGYNDDRTIETSLHRNYCRIKLKKLLLSAEQFGQYPDLKAIAIRRVFLMDVHEKVFPDGEPCDDGELFNVWNNAGMEFAAGGIGKCTVFEPIPAPEICPEGVMDADKDLYCPPSASTSLVIQADGIMEDGKQVTWYYRIDLECVSGTSYEYSICICGPGAPTPVDPMPQSSPLGITVIKWDKNFGCGYEESDHSMFAPSYTISLPSVSGGKGSLTFNRVLGKTSVRCGNEAILQVRGCGKYWELFPVGKGLTTLEICDGICSTKEIIQIE